MKKWNAASIKAAKGVHKLACLTAYDTGSARLADAAASRYCWSAIRSA